MITALIITTGLQEAILQYVANRQSSSAMILALTLRQRVEAIRQLNTNFMTEGWFIMIGLAAIIILVVLLFWVSYRRTAQARKVNRELFVQYADRRGLSKDERRILLDIANKVGLKRSAAIFTMAEAFDRGATQMVEESLAGRQTAEENKTFRGELSFLCEKLGFKKRPLSSVGSPTKSKKLSSRQIPVGKKLDITRRKSRDSDNIECTVIESNDMELTVKLAMPVESRRGELWRSRYYFGASVWEFDTSVVSCNGDILVLNHSDDIRFINRRRFLRVPVNKSAFVASFPFARTPQSSADFSIGSWGPPEFVPAVITELGGPGLRIETQLEVKVGDRVLVVFKLDEERDQDLSLQTGEASRPKIVEDIGQVRHIRDVQNGLSIAVELTGLSDLDVDELIRVTNAASLRVSAKGQEVSGSADSEEQVPQPVTAEGV